MKAEKESQTGLPLSPLLLNINTEELIRETFENKEAGVVVGGKG